MLYLDLVELMGNDNLNLGWEHNKTLKKKSKKKKKPHHLQHRSLTPSRISQTEEVSAVILKAPDATQGGVLGGNKIPPVGRIVKQRELL